MSRDTTLIEYQDGRQEELVVTWSCSLQGWRITVRVWEDMDLVTVVDDIQYIYPTLFEALFAAVSTAIDKRGGQVDGEFIEYYINNDLKVETLWEDDIEEVEDDEEGEEDEDDA